MGEKAAVLPAKMRRLRDAMLARGVDGETVEKVMAGAQGRANRQAQAKWFRGAMGRMDELVPADVRHCAREDCACCTGGSRHAAARQIAKNYSTADARLRALSVTSLIVGHDAQWIGDGKIRVRYAESADGAYCPCLTVSDTEPMPITYCYCCLGHIRGHVETALGVKTRGAPVTTLLSSCGKAPCVFDFEIVEA